MALVEWHSWYVKIVTCDDICFSMHHNYAIDREHIMNTFDVQAFCRVLNMHSSHREGSKISYEWQLRAKKDELTALLDWHEEEGLTLLVTYRGGTFVADEWVEFGVRLKKRSPSLKSLKKFICGLLGLRKPWHVCPQ